MVSLLIALWTVLAHTSISLGGTATTVAGLTSLQPLSDKAQTVRLSLRMSILMASLWIAPESRYEGPVLMLLKHSWKTTDPTADRILTLPDETAQFYLQAHLLPILIWRIALSLSALPPSH